MWKKLSLLVLAVLLLAVPVLGRYLFYYPSRYQGSEVPRPDLSQIKAATPESRAFVDRPPSVAAGTILVDLAHDNRVRMAELNVLQARLAGRDQRLESVTAAAGDSPSSSLGEQLRYAGALVVISPGVDWGQDEVRQVQEFVEKGGRLLLIADPSRYEVLYDEAGDYAGLDSDVPHINSLAATFGLFFQDDYLYNTTDNAGNFRNIKLTEFAEKAVVRGLQQVVFYAAHSIACDEPALIRTAGNTRSSKDEESGDLAVAALAADDAVLALGDLTFFTDPYSAAYDNQRLIAQIADFLSGAERQYELADFPFFFGDQAHLVYAGDPLLNASLLEGGSALQALFEKAAKQLTVREADEASADTLFFGLYQEAEEVKPYLAAAQVTLWITPTAPAAEEAPPKKALPTPTATEPVTSGLSVTKPARSASIAAVTPYNRIEIESLGEMVLTGTALLFLQSEGNRHVMVVLADNEEGLEHAIDRLKSGNLAGCVLREPGAGAEVALALCPTREGEGGGWQKPEAKLPKSGATPAVTETAAPPEPAGGILIVALDQGESRYGGSTDAELYGSILEDRYSVTLRSMAADGLPGAAELLAYDLIIWTGGDVAGAFDAVESELLLALMLEGKPMIVSGAYIGDSEVESVQRDLQVKDAGHPLAQGFGPDEVIAFVAPPSGGEVQVDVLETEEGDENAVVFVRGPESEDAGHPSIWVVEDEETDVRFAFIGVPIYLLPEEARSRLILNAVPWMLAP